MRLSRKYSRARELSFQQLINAKVADLDLRPAGTLRDCLIQVRHELKHNHISFFPHFYFGEEPWGCIDRTGSIEIPFYLANNDLRRVAERHRSEEHTSELQSQSNLVCRLLLEKKKKKETHILTHEQDRHTS